MDLASRLSDERRARLAAERLLDLKQAELFEANRRLGQHARQLTDEIRETRTEVAQVKNQHRRVVHQLGQATQRIEMVTDQLWIALKSIQDGFALFDPDGRLELANQAYLDVFDGIKDITIGSSYVQVLEVLSEEGLVDLQGESPVAWRNQMLDRWEQEIIPPQTVRLWDGRFIKIQDKRLKDGAVVSLAIDITELARMWSAVEEMPDGFVMYDPEDRLLMCNKPYKEIYAASAPAMEPGASFEDILRYGLNNNQYPDAYGREDEWLEERLDHHRAPHAQLEQQLEDGRWIRVYESETSDGGRAGLRIDITQVKEDQRRLKEAMHKAEAANRAKSAFLANMSHEIRTPMNGVIGMADLMTDTELSEDQQLYLDTIRSSGEALLVIINDILDYSKIEAEKLNLNPEPFDLERAVHDVVLLLQPKARDKDVALLVDYDMFLPTRFIGDPGRFRQILTNLIGNAVKFTVEGHVLVRVVGVTAPDGMTKIHLTIEDTGIGIPADKVDHVFGEFNQVEDEQNRKFEGTGLGLAISKRLVQMMDGEVWVESEVGQGSCFGLSIVLPAEEPAVVESPNIPKHVSRVLVVVSHTPTREILSKQLSILGLTTQFCNTGSDAFDYMINPPDVIIMEQELPDMEGSEFVSHLNTSGYKVPAIVLSDNPGQMHPDDAKHIHAVLQKPVPRRALFSALEKLRPLRRPDRPAAPAPANPKPAAARPPAETPAPGTALDVLVAEDNKTNQLVFKKMASSFNVELRFANNGIEAVNEFCRQRPDLIFMDISMPEMDGKQATREIRNLETDGDHVPIVAVTAHAMAGDKEVIIEAGLDDYLTKPLRKAQLGEKIAHFTEVIANQRKAKR